LDPLAIAKIEELMDDLYHNYTMINVIHSMQYVTGVLQSTAFFLLGVLLERPTRVYSRKELLDGVWGHDSYVQERTVDVHIGRLRKELDGNDGQSLIRTLGGGGY